MTALFDLDPGTGFDDVDRAQRVLDEAAADHAFTAALEYAKHRGGPDGLRRLRSYTRQIAAAESLILAEHVLDDGNTRRAERMLNDGRTSKKEQRKRASRARAVGKNPGLADRLAGGGISQEQVDVIADAAAKSDGEAAVDDELIDQVAAVPPEQGKAIADEFLAKRATADGVQSEHDRQRALRRASKYSNKRDGLDTVAIAGDGIAAKAMWDAIVRRADAIYKRDGGRDLPGSQHPRTLDQRRFDAACELITGTTITPDGRMRPETAATKPGTDVDKPSKRYTPSKTRPRIVIGLTVDKLVGRDPAEVAVQHGLGLIPDSVLANYAADADFMAALYDRNGEPLWLGRLHRYANATQMIALTLRDRGCVLCGADPARCQAHHTMPWNAQAKAAPTSMTWCCYAGHAIRNCTPRPAPSSKTTQGLGALVPRHPTRSHRHGPPKPATASAVNRPVLTSQCSPPDLGAMGDRLPTQRHLVPVAWSTWPQSTRCVFPAVHGYRAPRNLATPTTEQPRDRATRRPDDLACAPVR